MTAADHAADPAATPEAVSLMLPALAPHLAAALGELGEGEVLVAGERERVDALHLLGQPFMLPRAKQIAALVAESRLPAVSSFPQLTQAGVLMSYTWSLDDIVRRVPYYIDRILKGTPAGELPVEQPTRFYLALNLKSARALGLALPQALLLQADEVIE